MTSYVLLEQEDWFEDEIKFIRRAVSPGMRVVDIGANYGLYTLALSRCVTPSGMVWAIEPSAATVEYLKQSMLDNEFGNIRLIQAALSDHDGRARLNIYMDSELNSLVDGAGATDAETVDLVTLDHCAREHAWKDIDFLKLDAEGEEQRIIDGGKQFLAENSPLIMFELRHGQTVNHVLIDRFRDLGYAAYRLLPGLQLLSPLDVNAHHDNFLMNVFCCKPDRAGKLMGHGLLTGELDADIPRKYEEQTHWKMCISSKAYYGAFRGSWEGARRKHPAPGWEAYGRALGLYCLAHSDGIPVVNKGACLEQSRSFLERALDREENLPRLQTYARILSELGRREQAARVLHGLMREIAPDKDVVLDEPFIPAGPRFDHVPLKDKKLAVEWCLSCVFEQFEKLYSLSSFYVRDPELIKSSLRRMDYLCTHSFPSAEMERRRQLVRLLHGFQGSVEPSDLLARDAENNLNSQIWGNRSIKK
jgi:FkbM family methyltransferase